MSTAAATICSQLSSISGSANVIGDPAELSQYQVDGKAPSAAVCPGVCEEVAEIVKFATIEKLAIVASGARTKLGMGMPPRQYDLAVDMTRLSRVSAYDPHDLTLGVEAGVSLRDISKLLGEHRQFLPLLAPYGESATVGGTISAGLDGPLRQFYGTARDYVLGMEFVTGAGVLTKSGGRVVKNVAGYDIHKVMIGALGTLGIVTKVNFRTFPVPESMSAFVAECKLLEEAIDLRHRIAQSPFTPLMVETFSPGAAAMLSNGVAAGGEQGSSISIATKGWTVIVALAGHENVLERFGREYGRMAEQAGAIAFQRLAEKETQSLLARMTEFVPTVLACSPAATIMRMGVLAGRMKELLASAVRAAEAHSLEWVATARGLGVIYFALLPKERSEASGELVRMTTEKIFEECSRLEANATIPWCPTEWKNALRVWGPVRADLEQMRKLKTVFDPNNVFSPGRFVGGI
jgi:glycolate oxidase FAD binding subunit